MLGIQAQKQEVSLVFKCLDRTGNGIKIDEFKKLVAGDSNSYLKDNEQLLHMMTHERRASRIRSASMKVKKKSPNPIAVSPVKPTPNNQLQSRPNTPPPVATTDI